MSHLRHDAGRLRPRHLRLRPAWMFVILIIKRGRSLFAFALPRAHIHGTVHPRAPARARAHGSLESFQNRLGVA